MQQNGEETSRSLPVAAVVGGALGIVVWMGLAFGLKSSFGLDVWIGHVFSSPINAASFAAFGAALGQLLRRRARIVWESSGLSVNLLGSDAETLLLPDDVKTARKQLPSIPVPQRRTLPMRLLTVGLLRARAHWSATDVSAAIETEADLVQREVEASYSNIRYLAWAIPSIGFLGTVLGIGWAMGDINIAGSDKADPLSVATSHLSVAFDTTFVALALSLILMFIIHRVETMDDHLLIRAKSWSQRQLPLRMHIVPER